MSVDTDAVRSRRLARAARKEAKRLTRAAKRQKPLNNVYDQKVRSLQAPKCACGKLAFFNRYRADLHAALAFRDGYIGVLMRSYVCPMSGVWHLTSQRKRTQSEWIALRGLKRLDPNEPLTLMTLGIGEEGEL